MYSEMAKTTNEFNFYKVKNINENNYKDSFSNYHCVNYFFKNAFKSMTNSKTTTKTNIDLGKDDFLSDINDASIGCFNMKTGKKGDSVFGYAELIASSDDYGIVMQSEMNLRKDNSDPKSYFISRLSLLKKDNDNWKIDKALAWQEDKSSYEKIIDAPKEILNLWTKNDSKDDLLFQQFNFKKPTKLWKKDYGGGFTPTNFFVYKSDTWYIGEKINNNNEWNKKIPRGEWKILMNLEDLIKALLKK